MVTIKNIKDVFYIENTMIIDLHGCSKYEAEDYLEKIITYMLPEISVIIIIHGYRNGQVLKNMIKNELHNKRISKIVQCVNPGRTKLFIQ